MTSFLNQGTKGHTCDQLHSIKSSYQNLRFINFNEYVAIPQFGKSVKACIDPPRDKKTHLILALEHQDVGDSAEGDTQVDDLRLGDVVGDVPDVDHPRWVVLLHGVELGPLGLAVVVDTAVGGGSVSGRGARARPGGCGSASSGAHATGSGRCGGRRSIPVPSTTGSGGSGRLRVRAIKSW